MFGKRRMPLAFSIAELKAALERSLGFGIRSLTQLKSVNAANFKAVREHDGFAFTVKCIPPWRREQFEKLIVHAQEMKGTKAAFRLFERECPPSFRGYDLVCLNWCEGKGIPADGLTERELVDFLDDYRTFSAALQKATRILPQYEFVRWRAEALGKCRGFWGGLLRPVVEMAESELTGFCGDRLRVTHGDLHPGNFAFDRGRVSGFFDIEGFTWGYPAWDLVRYFIFSCEHLHWYECRRRRRLFGHFRTAVRQMGYPCDEWIASINAYWLEKVDKKTHGRSRIGPFQALPLLADAGLYRRFRAVVFDIMSA